MRLTERGSRSKSPAPTGERTDDPGLDQNASTTQDEQPLGQLAPGPGERVDIVGPDGQHFLARVESVTPNDKGFTLVAAVSAPRKFSDQLIELHLDPDGTNPHLSNRA